MVFLPFFKINVEKEPFFVTSIADSIAYNTCIAVAVVPVKLNQQVFVFTEFIGIKFWCAEDFAPPGVLGCFLENTSQFILAEGGVAVKGDFFNRDFWAFSNRKKSFDLILAAFLQSDILLRPSGSLLMHRTFRFYWQQ